VRPAALVVALGVWALAGDAAAYCRSTTSRMRATSLGECVRTGIPLSWRSRCTGFSLFRLNTPMNIPLMEFDRLARVATEAWARVPCDADGRGIQYFRVLPNLPTWNPSGYDPRGQNSNTIGFRPRWNDDAIHRPGAIAITIATFDSFTGEIFDADMEMNDAEFDFSIGTTMSDPSAADLQTILTHEFGHFMGLSHSDNDRAVMWPEAGLGEIRRDLTSDDSAGMCAIYPAAQTPAARCIAVPYGGLTTHAGGTLVTGTCSASPRTTSRGAWTALGLVALAALARRRERSITRPT
jgi:MYXO-CTERM domain-containing protein